ncbi:hypothetical protein [Bacillus phage SPO1L3]|nr:hypothetical protein [Bacillus phage SPO1L3]WIT26690.1 hypothetical protein [Bacillus phage SPO1L5]
MPTYYTMMGASPIMRRKMNEEFKRVGFKDIKEKRWFLNRVLGKAPYLSNMSIVDMSKVIEELRKYEDVSEVEADG